MNNKNIFIIHSIDHIVLRTSDVDAMVHFYCEILGGSVEKIQEEFGLTQLRIGDNIINLKESTLQ